MNVEVYGVVWLGYKCRRSELQSLAIDLSVKYHLFLLCGESGSSCHDNREIAVWNRCWQESVLATESALAKGAMDPDSKLQPGLPLASQRSLTSSWSDIDLFMEICEWQRCPTYGSILVLLVFCHWLSLTDQKNTSLSVGYCGGLWRVYILARLPSGPIV